MFIIGGGKHALEKIERLLPYAPCIRVMAPEFMAAIEELAREIAGKTDCGAEIQLVYREFQDEDLDELPLCVIAAGDDQTENRRISGLCRERRIPVNVVDDQEYCDFIFPSLIAKGNLSVGICTGGASPSTGVLLKRKIEAQIPENMEEILDWLHKKRPMIMESVSDKKQRFSFYYKLSEICMNMDRPLAEEEFAELLRNAHEQSMEQVKK